MRHAAPAAADRDRGGDVLSALAAAGQGRHEVLPDLELMVNSGPSAISSALRGDRLSGVEFAKVRELRSTLSGGWPAGSFAADERQPERGDHASDRKGLARMEINW